MGVQNPSSFEESTILSCMFEKKKNHNANPSCRCLEGNLSFCRGMIWHKGGREKRNSTQILSMTLNSNFRFSTSCGIFGYTTICAGNNKTPNHIIDYYNCFDEDLSLCRGMMGEQKMYKCSQIYSAQSGGQTF